MSNLQILGRRCPVMSKALAVQSARMSGTKRFTSCAAGVAGLGSAGHGISEKKHLRERQALHTTAGNGASLQSETYKKGHGMIVFLNMLHLI